MSGHTRVTAHVSQHICHSIRVTAHVCRSENNLVYPVDSQIDPRLSGLAVGALTTEPSHLPRTWGALLADIPLLRNWDFSRETQQLTTAYEAELNGFLVLLFPLSHAREEKRRTTGVGWGG